MLNIFRNYIPNKTIKCDYKRPPWMNATIISSLKKRSRLARKYYNNGQQDADRELLLKKSNECTEMVTKAKNDYLIKQSEKLDDPLIAPKAVLGYPK